jgi:hypothetical protein
VIQVRTKDILVSRVPGKVFCIKITNGQKRKGRMETARKGSFNSNPRRTRNRLMGAVVIDRTQDNRGNKERKTDLNADSMERGFKV